MNTATTMPSLLDLKAIDEPQRAALWSKTAKTYFPGLSVRDLRINPTVGAMNGMQFGAGRLWTVLSPPLLACYDPDTNADEQTQQIIVSDLPAHRHTDAT